jgi:uncharacterized repeat protein (TIGR01451 family)
VNTLGTPQSLTITNTGHGVLSLQNVQVTGADANDFVLSADGCSDASLWPGFTCTIGVRFGPTAPGPRTAALNVASNDPAGPLEIGLSGSGGPLADVAVALSGPSSAQVNSKGSYLVTVSNGGPTVASNVVMTYPVPSGTKFISATTTQGSCSASASTVTCALGDLANGAKALTTVALKFTLKPKGGNLTNTASAYSQASGPNSATPDPNLANNVASLNTTITK